MNIGDIKIFRNKSYINGEWAGSPDVFSVTNPATGEHLADVPSIKQDMVKKAIEGANEAWKSWKLLTAKERAAYLKKWYELILNHIDDLAVIMTLEQGKPLTEARNEILYGASFIEWFAEEGKRAYGEIVPTPNTKQRILVIKESVGVCAAITPWNFPAAMITRKVAPALAAGCTMVIKPASQTPLTALALIGLAEQAGFPKGVLSIVTGDAREIGSELTSNPLVRKVSFTGSTEIGKILMKQSATTVKKVSMELGGNAPFIVFDDADVDEAVQGAILSKFRNAGQTCVCANRLYVHKNIYEQFTAKLVEAVRQLKVGSGLEDGTDMGPLIDEKAVAKVQEHIQDALSKGATLLTGGKPHQLGGNFFEPTVVANVTQDMKVAKEETFGPLAPIFVFESEQEVIDKANDTEFGLACYFFTNNLSRVWNVAEKLEYGIVGINTGIISNEVAPFGGIKESGLGREGSRHGIDDYLTLKYMCMAGIKA
ncbi:NAD-dependent succinate-semialdehyde dehydrogenase [Pelistega europaea]|uniref:NAD-dependent succinate-semialdehyde dehydrogenase n=1 Tax=Pelistega europaea TaxID=106147 RepID=A0A7Y4LBJ8_9BURK|nr:NAD-dependent succinate-semialdehyde dehydrogenase [Pelistega europaea]NOL50438.1 NAD-dependent succinate-semialdehyde dehydrogenase [Pelistega europaea]